MIRQCSHRNTPQFAAIFSKRKAAVYKQATRVAKIRKRCSMGLQGQVMFVEGFLNYI